MLAINSSTSEAGLFGTLALLMLVVVAVVLLAVVLALAAAVVVPVVVSAFDGVFLSEANLSGFFILRGGGGGLRVVSCSRVKMQYKHYPGSGGLRGIERKHFRLLARVER